MQTCTIPGLTNLSQNLSLVVFVIICFGYLWGLYFARKYSEKQVLRICWYLIDMVGVGSSALQEHRGDPHVDESAMSSEWHQQQTIRVTTIISSRNINSVSDYACITMENSSSLSIKENLIWSQSEKRNKYIMYKNCLLALFRHM